MSRFLQEYLMGLPRFKNTPNRGGFTGVLEGKEGVDIDPDFFQSDFYKTYNDPKYTKPGMPKTMDMRFSKYFDVGGDQRYLDAAGFGRSPFMGGFGRSPFMGGYGSPFGGFGRSPFGGLGMFGMSPYGGYGGYGMFGGMMNPFMGGMGGFGQMQPYRGNLPFERRMRFPQQPQQQAVDRSTFVTDPTTYYKGDASTPNFQPSVGNQPTQQPFQSPNPFMNPFMSGLGSMMGNMFGGGYGSNVSNTQANVAQ